MTGKAKTIIFLKFFGIFLAIALIFFIIAGSLLSSTAKDSATATRTPQAVKPVSTNSALPQVPNITQTVSVPVNIPSNNTTANVIPSGPFNMPPPYIYPKFTPRPTVNPGSQSSSDHDDELNEDDMDLSITEECQLCYESFKDIESISICPCRHRYHFPCLKELFDYAMLNKNEPKCPHCEFPLIQNPEQLYEIILLSLEAKPRYIYPTETDPVYIYSIESKWKLPNLTSKQWQARKWKSIKDYVRYFKANDPDKLFKERWGYILMQLYSKNDIQGMTKFLNLDDLMEYFHTRGENDGDKRLVDFSTLLVKFRGNQKVSDRIQVIIDKLNNKI